MGVVGPYFQYISSSPRASTDRYISSSKIGYLSLDSAAPNRCGIIFSNVAEGSLSSRARWRCHNRRGQHTTTIPVAGLLHNCVSARLVRFIVIVSPSSLFSRGWRHPWVAS